MAQKKPFKHLVDPIEIKRVLFGEELDDSLHAEYSFFSIESDPEDIECKILYVADEIDTPALILV